MMSDWTLACPWPGSPTWIPRRHICSSHHKHRRSQPRMGGRSTGQREAVPPGSTSRRRPKQGHPHHTRHSCQPLRGNNGPCRPLPHHHHSTTLFPSRCCSHNIVHRHPPLQIHMSQSGLVGQSSPRHSRYQSTQGRTHRRDPHNRSRSTLGNNPGKNCIHTSCPMHMQP